MTTPTDRRNAQHALAKAEGHIDLKQDESAVVRLEEAIGLLESDDGD